MERCKMHASLVQTVRGASRGTIAIAERAFPLLMRVLIACKSILQARVTLRTSVWTRQDRHARRTGRELTPVSKSRCGNAARVVGATSRVRRSHVHT